MTTRDEDVKRLEKELESARRGLVLWQMRFRNAADLIKELAGVYEDLGPALEALEKFKQEHLNNNKE